MQRLSLLRPALGASVPELLLLLRALLLLWVTVEIQLV
jgi:hypothetical protein